MCIHQEHDNNTSAYYKWKDWIFLRRWLIKDIDDFVIEFKIKSSLAIVQLETISSEFSGEITNFLLMVESTECMGDVECQEILPNDLIF